MSQIPRGEVMAGIVLLVLAMVVLGAWWWVEHLIPNRNEAPYDTLAEDVRSHLTPGSAQVVDFLVQRGARYSLDPVDHTISATLAARGGVLVQVEMWLTISLD